MEPTSEPRAGPLPGALLGLLVAAFVVLKLHALRPAVGDEGIYFYLGSRAAQGLVPYRDFVFVHPPMHAYALTLAALVGRVTGSAFAVMKAMPALFALATGLALHDLARRPSLRRLLPGSYWPLVPVALYLFNYDTLRVSSHWVGVHQATCLALVGLALWERARPRLAGTAFAAALATATYAAPVLAGFFLVKLPYGRDADDAARQGFRRAAGATAVATLALHLPVWVLAAPAWWSQTVAFQLDKPAIGSTFATALRQLLAAEGLLVAASLIWTLRFLARPPAERLAWLPLVGLVYVAILSGLERVYIYYFVVALPLLALGAAFLLREAWARTREIWQRSRDEAGAALAALAPILIALAVQPLAYRSIPEVAEDPSATRQYTFRPTPGVGPVNRIVSALFVEQRRVGFPAPGVLRYLWHESTWWEGAGALARDIAEETAPDETLYGDSTTAPLLAFLAGRRIACELADTNTLHFRTGYRSVDDDLACARGDGLHLLVVQPRRGIGLLPEFERFVTDEATLWRSVDAGGRPLRLYRVGGDPGG